MKFAIFDVARCRMSATSLTFSSLFFFTFHRCSFRSQLSHTCGGWTDSSSLEISMSKDLCTTAQSFSLGTYLLELLVPHNRQIVCRRARCFSTSMMTYMYLKKRGHRIHMAERTASNITMYSYLKKREGNKELKLLSYQKIHYDIKWVFLSGLKTILYANFIDLFVKICHIF